MKLGRSRTSSSASCSSACRDCCSPVIGGFAKLLGAGVIPRSRYPGRGPSATSSSCWGRSCRNTGSACWGRTRRPGITKLLRSCGLFTSNLCRYFYAITFIPIAKAAAISLTAPLIVALLAWPMLGERTTPARVAALSIGFAGVLIGDPPGLGGVPLGRRCSYLVSATCYGRCTRSSPGGSPGWGVRRKPRPSTVPMVGAFGMLLVVPFVWRTPGSLGDVAMFASMGVLGGGMGRLLRRPGAGLSRRPISSRPSSISATDRLGGGRLAVLRRLAGCRHLDRRGDHRGGGAVAGVEPGAQGVSLRPAGASASPQGLPRLLGPVPVIGFAPDPSLADLGQDLAGCRQGQRIGMAFRVP